MSVELKRIPTCGKCSLSCMLYLRSSERNISNRKEICLTSPNGTKNRILLNIKHAAAATIQQFNNSI